MELFLIEPCSAYETGFMDMLKEFKDAGGPIPFVMHFGKNNFQEILQAAIDNASGENVTENMEPSTTWWLADESANLYGIVNIRHSLNTYLENYGGHIGYGIRPSERNKGYAKKLLSLALQKSKAMGLIRVLITCDKRNLASEKVIKANSGFLEDERVYDGMTMRRYWINLDDGTPCTLSS